MKDYESNIHQIDKNIVKMLQNERIARIEKQIFRINILGAILALSMLLHTAKEFLQ
jgi:hypothetical protein